VLEYLAGIVCDLEGPAVALRLSRRANRLWKTSGNPEAVAVSEAVLAVRLLDAGHAKEALRQSAGARVAMLSLGQGSFLKHMTCIGKEFLVAGHVAEAEAWLGLALETLAGAERSGALALLSRAMELQGRIPEALACQQESCKTCHLHGEAIEMAKAMIRLARLHFHLNQKWQAGSLCLEAIRILEPRGYKEDVATAGKVLRLCKGSRLRERGH